MKNETHVTFGQCRIDLTHKKGFTEGLDSNGFPVAFKGRGGVIMQGAPYIQACLPRGGVINGNG